MIGGEHSATGIRGLGNTGATDNRDLVRDAGELGVASDHDLHGAGVVGLCLIES